MNEIPPATERLRELEQLWEARFRLQPKLPSAALLTGAMAMACGFGAVMFLMFALAMNFQRWVPQLAVFAALALVLGLMNRYFARRWFEKVKVWSAEREALAQEIETLRKKTPST